ncbi:MAG: hypothetical protein HEQ19_25470 [Gloeotrichia echinulata CP02]
MRTLRERLRSVTRDCTSGADATRTAPLCYQGLGIALLVRTLRERLRSVTRDCTSGADATRTAPLCYQGLGIGLIYSLLITHYSLLITIGDWGVVLLAY